MAKKIKLSEWEAPAANNLKHKDVSSGLSITKKGRLIFTINLQDEMKIEPKKRDVPIYVKILFKKDQKYVFYLQFFHDDDNKPADAKYKLYKPKREKEGIYSSHFEMARFLKERGLIDEVGKAFESMEGGPVEILEKDIENRSLVIDLSKRFKKKNQE